MIMAKRSVIAWLVVLAAACIAGYIYWHAHQQDAGTVQKFPPAVISSVEVSEELWEPRLQSVGSLVAINGIELSTEVNGIVSEVVFESGQKVTQGQILIKLDDSVDVAALEALKAERKLARVEFNRAADLLKKNVTSKSDYDEAKARFEAADARVKQQEAIIKRKVVRAPFAGLAGIRNVDPGQYIEAGSSIVSLQTLDPIYVDYTLPERYMSMIETGQVVKLRLDAAPGKIFEGKVSALNSSVNPGTRTIRLRATLGNPDNELRPGMFAETVTITGDAVPVKTLPRTAISFNTYGNFVYVISDNGEQGLAAKRTPVQTGDIRNGRVEVGGIEPGTQVVRTGLVKLLDGMSVVIDNSVVLDDQKIEGE